MIKEQALIYLFKAWMTASVVFPIVYTLYYLNFVGSQDGMIWLWLVIAIPILAVCSLVTWLLTYLIFLGMLKYTKTVYLQKIWLCVSILLMIAIIYISFFGFINSSVYSIGMVLSYYLVLTGFIWLYRLKPIEV